MAGFRMHVTTSAVLGCGYAAAGHAVYDVPLDTAIVAGAMCGFSGMLPDLDSDYGVPLRETMAFTAAIVPMLLVGHFQTLSLTHDAMILVAVSLYLFVRFGITNMVRKYTVHRGMFHSIPAGLVFAGLAFLACGTSPLEIRCYKAGGAFGGFMSHLLLDEIYAIEWKGGRWKFKKSFGTALKIWGDDAWANFSTYAKLSIVVMVILGEPTVVEQLQARHPGFAQQLEQLQRLHQRFDSVDTTPGAQAAPQFSGAELDNPTQSSIWPSQTPGAANPFMPGQAPVYQDSFDTAQRPSAPYPQ